MAIVQLGPYIYQNTDTGVIYNERGQPISIMPGPGPQAQQQSSGGGGGAGMGALLGATAGGETALGTTEGTLATDAMLPGMTTPADVSLMYNPGTGALESGTFSTPPAAGFGTYALPAAGALIGGLMARQGYRKGNPLTGALGGGLLAGSGIGLAQALGMGALGPVGLAAALGGGALLGGLGGILGRKPRTEVEDKRWRSLVDKGLVAKEWLPPGTGEPTKGNGQRFDDVWKAAATPEDKAKMLWGYAGLTEKFGADYWKAGEKARMDVAKLFGGGEDSGAFREHHGTVDFNWTPERETAAREIIMKALQQPQKVRDKRVYT